MTDRERDSRRMLVGLLDASHLMPLEQVPGRVAEYAAPAGLRNTAIYLCDLRESVLRLLTGNGPNAHRGRAPGSGAAADEAELKVEGTLPGRAFQEGRTVAAGRAGGSGYRWWVPVLDGTERLGVLRVDTGFDDAQAQHDLLGLAALVGLLIVSKRGTSDAYARLRRTERMNVAAEMQWNLMPPRIYADERVVIGGVMEPAYEVGGDAFDFATAGDIVHLSVFDAMGHDTAAALTANLAVAACRNHRRKGRGLVETGEAIEQVVVEQFGRSRFVTGILGELDLRTGVLSWVNRGHLPPVLIRAGRWESRLHCPPAHPMGTALGLPSQVCREQLEPGDRVVLYTDGITEAHRPGGPEFGLERFIDVLIRHHADHRPVPETLRRLVRSILDHHQGCLSDDATVLLLQWHGSSPFPPPEVRALAGVPS